MLLNSSMKALFLFKSYTRPFDFFLMYWSTDDLQCCVNFCYKAKSLSYTHIYFFHLLFYSGLSQDTEYSSLFYTSGFPGGASGKELACQCRRLKRYWFDPWVRKIPWRRAWQPTPLFLRGESHGQRSLVGYSPWGHKVPNTTEWLTLFTFFQEWVSLLRTYTEDWSKPHLGCWTIYL